MNYSRQREAMLKLLRNSNDHPTANEIYERMRRDHPRISLGTVYRNLALLTDNGIIKRIDTDDEGVHYDGYTAPHYHFVCSRCGSMCDVHIPQINVDNAVEAECGGEVRGHSLIFYGICKECKNL